MSTQLELQDTPFISVVMPVYNAARYVAEAISSILAQTHRHFEFIIVDDGSTDGSAGIVREFVARDARIRPLFLDHRGQAFALNTGIALAQGKFIAHMENDDIALPERFAIQLDWLRRSNVDLCGGYLKTFGDQSRILWFPETHDAICRELVFRIGLHHGTSMVRAEIAKSHPFDEHSPCLDYEMFTRLGLRYRLGNVPQVLLKWRNHVEQTHRVNKIDFKADLSKLRRRYARAIFPDATAEDYAVLARLAELESFDNLAELERAGTWLERLAQTPDKLLRERMAERWLAVCVRSAPLGFSCFNIYQRHTAQFGLAEKPSARKLWLRCALRLKPGSRREALLKKIASGTRRPMDKAVK